MRLLALLLCVAAVGTGCGTPAPPPAPEPEPVPKPAEPNDGWPTRGEVLAYLDGKSVPFSDPNRPSGERDTSHVLKRDQIEALEVKHSGTRVEDGPWDTPVSFIFNTAAGRYAVDAVVSHKLIENKRAFFGFRVRAVSKL
jgi:hypothetical protein